MKQSELMNILDDVATGKVTKEEALLAIKEEPFKDMGFAKIDTHRGIRQGVPEVLYGAGKTKEQIKEIVKYLQKSGEETVLITRMSSEAAKFVSEEIDLNKDLNQYDGYIKIPKLNLELPVMKKPTQANLKKSPCIYSGTAKDSNLIIAAHNYSAHFGKINQLENGDKVQYTDLQNNTYNYCVTAKEKINGSNSEQMQNENYALTLFTCDYTGRDRITIRCERK